MIRLHKTLDTQRTEFWIIEYKGQMHRIATIKNRQRRGLENLRYVICRTLKINATQFIFLGNVRVNGNWVTEWMMK